MALTKSRPTFSQFYYFALNLWVGSCMHPGQTSPIPTLHFSTTLVSDMWQPQIFCIYLKKILLSYSWFTMCQLLLCSNVTQPYLHTFFSYYLPYVVSRETRCSFLCYTVGAPNIFNEWVFNLLSRKSMALLNYYWIKVEAVFGNVSFYSIVVSSLPYFLI